MSFEVILPFLRPIEHLIRDGEISEIMVNGSGRIFIERHGQLLPIPDATIPEKSLQVAVRNIARTLGDEVNDEMPLLDARLPDGSRVAAAIPPCSRRVVLPKPATQTRKLERPGPDWHLPSSSHSNSLGSSP